MPKIKRKVLPLLIRRLAFDIINETPNSDVGYAEAADMVSDMWDQFIAAGAALDDLDNILNLIRWAKWEGFGFGSPLL